MLLFNISAEGEGLRAEAQLFDQRVLLNVSSFRAGGPEQWWVTAKVITSRNGEATHVSPTLRTRVKSTAFLAVNRIIDWFKTADIPNSPKVDVLLPTEQAIHALLDGMGYTDVCKEMNVDPDIHGAGVKDGPFSDHKGFVNLDTLVKRRSAYHNGESA